MIGFQQFIYSYRGGHKDKMGNITSGLSESHSFSGDKILMAKFEKFIVGLGVKKSTRLQYLIRKDLIENKVVLPNRSEELCFHCGGLMNKK